MSSTFISVVFFFPFKILSEKLGEKNASLTITKIVFPFHPILYSFTTLTFLHSTLLYDIIFSVYLQLPCFSYYKVNSHGDRALLVLFTTVLTGVQQSAHHRAQVIDGWMDGAIYLSIYLPINQSSVYLSRAAATESKLSIYKCRRNTNIDRIILGTKRAPLHTPCPLQRGGKLVRTTKKRRVVSGIQ